MENKKIREINDGVRFFGRTARIPGTDGTFFNWSGSGFTFRFSGSTAEAYLLTDLRGKEIAPPAERAFLGVFVDGAALQTARFPLSCPAGWYPLCAGLPAGEHTVTVVKQTEAGYGRAALAALKTDGILLPPSGPPPLRLEFIGDSITCGYGNLNSTESPDFTTAEENFSLTYAAETARLLGAEATVVAASGNGIAHDYGCGDVNLIPELYLYADKMLSGHYGSAPEKWNFSAESCAAVIIKLGQNDGQYCAGAGLPAEKRTKELLAGRHLDFERQTERFLEKVLSLRRGVPVVFLLENDMYLKPEVFCAVDAVNRAYGREAVFPFEIAPKQPWEGVGANGHWSVCTHARAAQELARFLKGILCLQ